MTHKIAICAPSHNLSGWIFATKACVDNRKKNLLSSNISSTCPRNMANFGPLAAEIVSGVWGPPANFNGFRVLPSLLQWRRLPEANQTLHSVWPYSWAATLYIFGGTCPLTEFCLVKNSLYIQVLLFFYIGSVTARHSSSRHQPNFAAWYKEWNYRTFADGATYIWEGGHHVGHRRTF